MKRFVEISEGNEVLSKFTGVRSSLIVSEERNNSYEITWKDPKFMAMHLCINQTWFLDEHNQLVCPLAVVRNPAYLIHMEFRFTPDKEYYVVAGQLSYGMPVHKTGGIPSLSLLPVNHEDATHFLVMERIVLTDDSVRGHTGWHPIPLLNANGAEALYDTQRKYEAWKATSSTNNGYYWQFYLLPIGYCKPPIVDNAFHYNYLLRSEEEKFSYQFVDVIECSRPVFKYQHSECVLGREMDYGLRRGELEQANQEAAKSLLEKCEELNARLEKVRKAGSPFAELGQFKVDGKDLAFMNKIYGVDEATELVGICEIRMNRYLTYKPLFEELRGTIEEVSFGMLKLGAPNYAEVSLPKPAFAPDEPLYVTKRFPYNPHGVAACKKWLKEMKTQFAESTAIDNPEENGN